MLDWIKAAGIRAIKTVAQTAVATIGTSVALGDVNLSLIHIWVYKTQMPAES